MIDLSQIKSKKLKELMEKSIKFGMLPEEEQQMRIEEIANLPAQQQEELYCPFFEKENAEEATKMEKIEQDQQQAIAELMIQIDEMDKRISKLEKEDIELVDREKEVDQQEKLLEELNNI